MTKTTLSTISYSAGTLIALLISFELRDFLNADKCLDLGGKVMAWGGCEFAGDRAQVLELSKIEFALILVVGVIICNIIGYGINAIGTKVFKI